MFEAIDAIRRLAWSHRVVVRHDDASVLANEVNRIEGVERDDNLELLAACMDVGAVSDKEAISLLMASVPASGEEAAAWDPFGDVDERGLLRNHFGIGNKRQLDAAEFVFIHKGMKAAMSAVENAHEVTVRTWLEVHSILFGALYPWAGRVRSHHVQRVYRFNAPERVLEEADEVFRKASGSGSLPDRLGETYGLLAFCHPFYDGNGRSLNVVVDGLLKRQGFELDWHRLDRKTYMAHLTNAAFGCSYDGLGAYLASLLR